MLPDVQSVELGLGVAARWKTALPAGSARRHPGRGRFRYAKTRRPLLGLVPVAILCGLWEVSAASGWISSDNWPRFSVIVATLAAEIRGGEVVRASVQTIELVLAGFAMGALLGVGFALFTALRPLVGSGLILLVELLRVVPVPALIPPLVLLFGTGLTMKLVVVAASVLFPVFVNARAGISAIEPQLRLVARMHKLGTRTFARAVLIPGALPGIFVGLRVGFGIALVVAVTAEIIVGDSGLGHYLMLMQFATRPAEMYGGVLVLLLFGYAASLPFKWLESTIVFRPVS